MSLDHSPAAPRPSIHVIDRFGLALRVTIVGLTLATAIMHLSLGGLMFTAIAAGYAGLAVAMATPFRPAMTLRWLSRLALIGFTLSTIGGWLLFGARFPMAYVNKAIEVILVVALAIEVQRYDGGPAGVARRMLGVLRAVLALFAQRRPV